MIPRLSRCRSSCASSRCPSFIWRHTRPMASSDTRLMMPSAIRNTPETPVPTSPAVRCFPVRHRQVSGRDHTSQGPPAHGVEQDDESSHSADHRQFRRVSDRRNRSRGDSLTVVDRSRCVMRET